MCEVCFFFFGEWGGVRTSQEDGLMSSVVSQTKSVACHD